MVDVDFRGNKITVRKNSGANVGARRRLNFIEGSNVTLTITDDPIDQEIDITIASAGKKQESHITFVALALEQSF